MDYRQQTLNLISTMIELNCPENMIRDITAEYQGCYEIIKTIQSAGHSVAGITCSYKDFTTQKFWEHYKTKPAHTWLVGNRESTLASMKPVFEPPIHPGSQFRELEKMRRFDEDCSVWPKNREVDSDDETDEEEVVEKSAPARNRDQSKSQSKRV